MKSGIRGVLPNADLDSVEVMVGCIRTRGHAEKRRRRRAARAPPTFVCRLSLFSLRRPCKPSSPRISMAMPGSPRILVWDCAVPPVPLKGTAAEDIFAAFLRPPRGRRSAVGIRGAGEGGRRRGSQGLGGMGEASEGGVGRRRDEGRRRGGERRAAEPQAPSHRADHEAHPRTPGAR